LKLQYEFCWQRRVVIFQHAQEPSRFEVNGRISCRYKRSYCTANAGEQHILPVERKRRLIGGINFDRRIVQVPITQRRDDDADRFGCWLGPRARSSAESACTMPVVYSVLGGLRASIASVAVSRACTSVPAAIDRSAEKLAKARRGLAHAFIGMIQVGVGACCSVLAFAVSRRSRIASRAARRTNGSLSRLRPMRICS